MVVTNKGSDTKVIARIARLIADLGLMHFAYRSDKEPSIVSVFHEACIMSGRNGVLEKGEEDSEVILEAGEIKVGEIKKDQHPRALERAHVAVPEHSHPGESQSNGSAERAVHYLVDHVKVLKMALGNHLDSRLPLPSPRQ